MSINVSDGIDVAAVDKFHDDLYQVCQQKESLFGQAIRTEYDLKANEDKAFDLMDELSLTEKTGSAPDTPEQDLSMQRRWIFTTPYHDSILLDRDDDLDRKLSMEGEIVTGFRKAINRKKDDIIYAAFEATVQSGRRNNSSTITWSGQNGNIKYSGKDTGRTIPWDCSVGNCVSSDVGMTAEKAELIIEYFANNHVDDDVPIFCAISPRQATQLFGQEEYVNKDYGSSGPMATGRFLRNWMGINWIRSTKVVVDPDDSTNDVDGNAAVFECWAWAMDGMILGVADELTIEVTIESTKSYARRVYVHMNMGAMRFDEDKILKIECKE